MKYKKITNIWHKPKRLKLFDNTNDVQVQTISGSKAIYNESIAILQAMKL